MAVRKCFTAFWKGVASAWKLLVAPLFEPWRALKGRHFHFISWLLGVPVIGLAGFWLPLAIVWFRGSPVYTVFEQLLYAGTLASFCVAILAEGLLSLLTAEKTGSNFNALGIRGMVGAWAIGIIILLVGVMGADVALASGPHVGVRFHVLLGVIALSTAAYLYCFRFPSWEKGVEDAKEEEEHEVAELGASAKEQSVDGGTKL
jgi:hypothetical protein